MALLLRRKPVVPSQILCRFYRSGNEDDDHFSNSFMDGGEDGRRRPQNNYRDDFRPRNDRFRPRNDGFRGGRRDGPPPWDDEDSFSRGGRGEDRMSGLGRGLTQPRWDKIQLVPLKKDFYEEVSSVRDRPKEEIDKYFEENKVRVIPEETPNKPVFSFKEIVLPEVLEDQVQSKFTIPTVIQSLTMPIALSGRDIVSIAETGSGKTLAYTLPAIVHMINQAERRRGEGPLSLVLCPTRELAQQVYSVVREFASTLRLNAVCIFGGSSRVNQERALRSGVSMAIATPGRLLDFLESEVTDLQRCSYLVVDEADRMLDMGFEPQIRKIVAQIRPDRQTLMFSATWPNEVRRLARDFLNREAVFVNVGSMELAANHSIVQRVEVMENREKLQRLIELLETDPDKKVLIFAAMKRTVDVLTSRLRGRKLWADGIHGDKSQMSRDQLMEGFRRGKPPILIATDVVARGIDVRDIDMVVNFDFPNDTTDYIHRIGRTGRVGRKGVAHTFFTPENQKHAGPLIDVLKEANQEIPPELEDMSRGRGYRKGRRSRTPLPRRARVQADTDLEDDYWTEEDQDAPRSRSF